VVPSTPSTVSSVARSAREWQQQHPTWLYAGLLAGTVADRTSTSHERHEVAVDELGTVPLPDGRLVACDPYVGGAGAAPFRTLLPRGKHPAYLARTRITDDHWRVMAVVLATGPGPVSSWSMGRVGEEVLPTKAGEYTGFGVAMVDLMVLNDPFASPEDELETAAPSPGRGGFWTRLLGRR